MTPDLVIEAAEARGYSWMVRSVDASEDHMDGDYFAHIYGSEMGPLGFVTSFVGFGETYSKALHAAYQEMTAAES